jgi:hypothetical protein
MRVRCPLFGSSLIGGVLVLIGTLGGCGGEVAIKPVERLDEQSALTVAVLANPIALLATGTQVFGKQVSMAYVGPVEWNRMGNISYSLWLELAPTDDQHFKDVTEPKSVIFLLDDGPLVLSPGAAPRVGREPYQPLASWGQTIYFEMSLEDLKRLAATRELRVRIRRIGGVDVDFEPAGETHSALTEYLNGRLVTWDGSPFHP